MRLTEFDGKLDEFEYPTTTDEIVAAYGGRKLRLAAGDETVEQALSRCGSESFTTADEARLTLYSSVSEGAIGRKHYSDRDPPMFGETPQVSF